MEDILFFFGIEGEKGYLSNWYPVKLKLVFQNKEYDFENVEQAMMAGKAMLFNDIECFN